MITLTGTGILPSGVISPLLMPFDDEGEPDFESLAREASWAADQGVDGVWLNGSTGEFTALSDDERTEVVRVVADELKGRDIPIVSQVGSTSTRLAVQLAASAVEAGATAVSVVLPYYLSYEQDECRDYLRDIKSTAGVPLYLYQIPAMTKTRASESLILELLQDSTIDGMKDSQGDMVWLARLLENVRGRGLDLPTYVGNPALIIGSMTIGVVGSITAIADVIPRHISRSIRAAQIGDWERAVMLQEKTLQFFQAICLPSRPHIAPVAALKCIMVELGVIDTAGCAAPFMALDDAERAWVRDHALPLALALEEEE